MAKNNKLRNFQDQWKSNIDDAKKCREEWRQKFRVKLANDFYEGAQNVDGVRDEDWITNNKIFSHVEAQLPSLFAMNPYFYVKLKRSYSPDPQDIQRLSAGAKSRQAFLNYLKEEEKLKQKAQLCILDAFFQFGCMKSHYSVIEADNPRKGKPILSDEGEPLLDPDTGEELVEPDTIPTEQKYKFTRVNPDRFMFSDDSGSVEDDWSWVGEEVKKTLREIKSNKRFSREAIKQIEASISKSFKKDRQKDVNDEPVEYIEIYDIKKRSWFIICEKAEEPLLRESSLPPGVKAHPYSILVFSKRRNSPYPIPIVSQVLDQQTEFNKARSTIMVHRNRFNRKYEVNADLLEDEQELTKLETGEDGTIIRSNAPPGTKAVNPIQDAPLNQQTYLEVGFLNNDIAEIFGSPDEARGISGSDSATEAAILDKHFGLKEGSKSNTVVDWLTEVAQKQDYLVQTHITEDEAVSIIGPSGEESWEIIRAADFQDVLGEYRYSVNTGSLQQRIPQVERAQFTALMSQVIIPMPQLLLSESLTKRIFEMYGIEDEVMIAELKELAKMMLSQQGGAIGGAPGSIAGVPNEDPRSIFGGIAGGDLGGTNNGGGSPQLASVQ